MIARDESSIVRDLQLAIRRELDRRGTSLKVIGMDSGIPYSTLLSYFPGERDAVPHAMPVAALRKLTGHIPPDLLSLLLPDGWAIVRVPELVDHDVLCDLAEAYAREKLAAHRADSECAERLGPGELDRLNRKVVELRSVAA